MATELAKDPRFRVSFLVRSESPEPTEWLEGVQIVKWTPPRGGLPSLHKVTHKYHFWRILEGIDPDVVVQRCAALLTTGLALYCRLRRRKFVYMAAHDTDLGTDVPPWWGEGGRARRRWALYRLGLRLADRVIVQHGDQLALLRAHYGKEGVVRPCVQRLPEAPAPPRERFILWVARGEPWKQPEQFLALARAFPRERFIMVCPPADGDPSVSRRARAEALTLGNLEYRGLVPPSEAEELFSRALLYVNTSRSEGFPNTFVQAWKHGTPVLSLAVDPDRVIATHRLGAACDGDPERMRGELAALLDQPARWEACSRNALAYVREHHDLRRQIERDKCVLTALSRKGAPGGEPSAGEIGNAG
jgi:glycosyltransferase involved in cell wall biosynthesis